MKKRSCCTVCTLAFAACLALAQVPDSPEDYQRPAENIALHKPYTLSPNPGYQYCTDPGDATQLTDGQYTEGHFWTQPGTVGWQHVKPAVITVDLGRVEPIRGVSLRTAAGVAGVNWPAAIYLFVADDDKSYHWVGDLVALSAHKGLPPKDGYATHRFWTDELQTHGRYIAFAVLDEPYTFVDEVEVYAGDSAWAATPLPGAGTPDIATYMKRLSIRISVEHRIKQDTADVRKAIDAATIPDDVRAKIMGQVESVDKALEALPADFGPDFRAVLPLNALHVQVFAAQAALWAAEGRAPLTVWQSPLWDALSPVGLPPAAGTPRVDLYLMDNEYRAGAFNLSNATPEPMEVTVRVAGLPGAPMPPYIAVQQVEWTDTKTGTPVAAALPEAPRIGDGWRVRVEPGLTRQVWLTVHPENIAAGRCEGRIELAVDGQTVDIPLSLTVYPLRFPDRPRLHFGGWDYTDQPSMYQVTPENREKLIAHLRAHFVDSPWGTSACMPQGQYDGEGHLATPPDTSHFDAWVDRWAGAAQYCVFASVGGKIGSWAPDAPQFSTAARAWIEFWAEHIRQRGLKPEQFAVLLVDEPHAAEQDAIILAWARALRAANTGLRVWEDPTYKDITHANPDMIALCDVLCPNRPIYLRSDQASRDFYEAQRQRGATLEFYSCSGPMRLLDPYTYCRLQAWTCWQTGAKASYFWAFGDDGGRGGSSWNEYAAERTAYTPVFLDATSVTAGKHLEAMREGIEDYEYLAMLQDAIDAASQRGVDAAVIEKARALLRNLPAKVCAAYDTNPGFSWTGACDRTTADEARREILEALVALKPGGQ